MKLWAWVVAGLYVAILLVLTVPVIWLAFGTKISLSEVFGVFASHQYWLWLAVMLASQVALLAVPVRVASRRPVTQGPLWLTVLAGGLMAGGLAAGAFLALYEFFARNQSEGNGFMWVAVILGLLSWGLWTWVFFRLGCRTEPDGLILVQCRSLLKGSILELLIAVPTHIVARYRDYCCAGALTFIGLTMGVSVMLFAFGPAVFFLFVQRWKRLHPTPSQPTAASDKG